MPTRRAPSSADRPHLGIVRRAAGFAARAVGVGLFLLAVVIGYGTSGDDYTRIAQFTAAVQGWQSNTDFRQVAAQYATRGSDAMRSTPMGPTAARWIVAIRSIPGLPKQFAVNDTSRVHYANFSKGPLSAYLHLCSEVELLGKRADGTVDDRNGYLPEFEGLFGRSAGGWTNAELFAYLDKQKWDFPVVKDAGAVESLRSMLADTDVAKGYTVRAMHVDGLLRPHVGRLAAELKLPADPEAMTPAQQYAVFDRLDGYVRRHDPELWRTKQVSDFVGGIWGQVFSPPYTILLSPYLVVVDVCRWLVPAALAIVLVVQVRRDRRGRADVSATEEPGSSQPAEAAAGTS